MKTKLVSIIIVLSLACSALAGERSEATANGAILGGIAGAVIGNNSGSRNGGKGAIIGAVAGGLLGNIHGANKQLRRQDQRAVWVRTEQGGYYQQQPREVYSEQFNDLDAEILQAQEEADRTRKISEAAYEAAQRADFRLRELQNAKRSLENAHSTQNAPYCGQSR